MKMQIAIAREFGHSPSTLDTQREMFIESKIEQMPCARKRPNEQNEQEKHFTLIQWLRAVSNIERPSEQ